MKLKYLGTDVLFGDKIDQYMIKGIDGVQFIIHKETIGAYDENNNESIGIGGKTYALFSYPKGMKKHQKEMIKKVKTYIKNKGYETSNVYSEILETETYNSPDELDNIFNVYVEAIMCSY